MIKIFNFFSSSYRPKPVLLRGQKFCLNSVWLTIFSFLFFTSRKDQMVHAFWSNSKTFLSNCFKVGKCKTWNQLESLFAHRYSVSNRRFTFLRCDLFFNNLVSSEIIVCLLAKEISKGLVWSFYCGQNKRIWYNLEMAILFLFFKKATAKIDLDEISNNRWNIRPLHKVVREQELF